MRAYAQSGQYHTIVESRVCLTGLRLSSMSLIDSTIPISLNIIYERVTSTPFYIAIKHPEFRVVIVCTGHLQSYLHSFSSSLRVGLPRRDPSLEDS